MEGKAAVRVERVGGCRSCRVQIGQMLGVELSIVVGVFWSWGRSDSGLVVMVVQDGSGDMRVRLL